MDLFSSEKKEISEAIDSIAILSRTESLFGTVFQCHGNKMSLLQYSDSSLSVSEKTKLTEEVELLSNTLSFGQRSEGGINEDISGDLVNNVAEKFPFLFDIVKTLFY